MAANTNKTFEVVLNGPAMGLTDGNNIKEITAASYVRNEANNSVSFLDSAGNEIAFFQLVQQVMVKP